MSLPSSGVLAALAIVVLAGGALRAVEAASPRLSDESVDERFYGTLAGGLADHLQYGGPSTGLEHPLHAAPGAPMLFALGHRLTPAPPGAPSDIPAAYWLLAGAGVLLIVTTFALARELAGDLAGVVAAAVVAFYPPLVRTTGELLSEPPGALTLTLGVLALVVARRTTLARYAVLGGALLGATALFRADVVFAPFVCAAVLAWLGARRLAVLALVSAGLVLAPWTVYASTRAGYFVPVIENDAPTLFIGTYLPGDGTNFGLKHALGDEVRARFPRLRHLPDQRLPGVDVMKTIRVRHPGSTLREALQTESRDNLRRYALGRPGAFAMMMVRKVARMWTRPSQDPSVAMRMVHLILLATACAGLALGLFADRGGPLLLPAAMLASSTLLHAVVTAHPRHGLPLIALLAAGGAAGLASAVGKRAS